MLFAAIYIEAVSTGKYHEKDVVREAFLTQSLSQAGYLFNNLHVDVDSLAGAEVAEESDKPVLRLGCLDVGAPDSLVVGVSGLADFLSPPLHATTNQQSKVSEELITSILYYCSRGMPLHELVSEQLHLKPCGDSAERTVQCAEWFH